MPAGRLHAAPRRPWRSGCCCWPTGTCGGIVRRRIGCNVRGGACRGGVVWCYPSHSPGGHGCAHTSPLPSVSECRCARNAVCLNCWLHCVRVRDERDPTTRSSSPEWPEIRVQRLPGPLFRLATGWERLRQDGAHAGQSGGEDGRPAHSMRVARAAFSRSAAAAHASSACIGDSG